MEICKFNGNSTASVEGMQHVAKLIMNNQPTIAILSAAEDVTKHLDEIAACFFNRNTEEAHEKITRLEFYFIDFANELLTDDEIKHHPMSSSRMMKSSIRPSGAYSIVSRLSGSIAWNPLPQPTKKTFWHKENYSPVH